MRSIFTFICVLLCLQPIAQVKKEIESSISKVTVFLEGAQVERTAKSGLVSGKQELIFTNISPFIDKQSIQVKTDQEITVLSVIHQQNFMKEQRKQEEIQEIESLRSSLAEQMALQRNVLNVYKQEEAMLIKNQQIGGANNGLKAADLKEAADFQRARLTEVYHKQMETERALRKMDADLKKMDRQLQELNQKADKSTSEIHVTVSTREAQTGNFVLSYLVKKAGWFPTYDIRVKDIVSPIRIQYRANVFQSSGEDWKNVKLFLSTGNPNLDGNSPVIIPWYLRYTSAQVTYYNTIGSGYSQTRVTGKISNEKGEPVPGATVMVKGTTTGVAADANGFFSIQLPSDNKSLVISAVGMEAMEVIAKGGHMNILMNPASTSMSEVVVTGMGQTRSGWETDEEDVVRKKEIGYSISKVSAKSISRDQNIITTISYQPTTTVYEIRDPYSILNDGKTYMAEIDGYEVKALYEYYAVPKLEPDAYLTARIIDWQDLNLLSGEANLFFEGTFLGKSVLDLENAGDTLQLSLGRDKGVAVKRTLLRDYSSKKFLGNARTDSRQYEILIRNNKQLPIHIKVEDQFPISTQKEIEVQSRKYDGAELEDDTQRITWLLDIEPKKERNVEFRYEVKYPKDKRLAID